MITSRRTSGLVYATTFFIAGLFFQPSQCVGRDFDRDPNGRIPIEHARRAKTRHAIPGKGVAGRTVSKSGSTVARAAKGLIPTPPPERPLDGSLMGTLKAGNVAPVGYQACGPVCDCGNCGAEAACGIEGVYHQEPGCGIEIGCGIGHAISQLGPAYGCGGCGACDDCCDTACGVEDLYVGACDGGDCACDDCRGCGVGRIPLCVPFLRINWARFDFFSGMQGFKGPLNFTGLDPNNASLRSGSGSFGFHQGFNHGTSLKRLIGVDVATQLGVRTTQSNLSGAEFTPETRYQVFVTGGFFRRVDYGLQYGLVFDYLNQDWYFRGNSIQLRGELSWRCRPCDTAGFQFMAGLDTDTSATVIDDGAGNGFISAIAFEPTTQYRFFYRRYLPGSGECNAFLGWTDQDDGLLGGSLMLPLRRRLVLSTSATYLVPRQGNRSGGFQEEGWNISTGLVFRVGGPKGHGRYGRPMFDVADNGTFMLDLR